MNTENNMVEFGTVKFFDRKKNLGYVIRDNVGSKDIRIHSENGPKRLFTGVDLPEFGDDFISPLPISGDRLVFVRDEKFPVANNWSYEKLYHDLMDKILARQEFLVSRRTKLHGCWGDWREVARGSAIRLAHVSPRDGQHISDSDEFAPSFWTGKFLTQNRFQILVHGEGFVDYEFDPRPFPSGKLYRVMLFAYGDLRQIGYGTLEELTWKYERGAKNDRLAPMSKDDDRRHLYWEVRENDDWVLCEEDPRPLPIKLPTETLIVSRSPAIPQACPSKPVKQKTNNEVVLKSLDALELISGNFKG